MANYNRIQHAFLEQYILEGKHKLNIKINLIINMYYDEQYHKENIRLTL